TLHRTFGGLSEVPKHGNRTYVGGWSKLVGSASGKTGILSFLEKVKCFLFSTSFALRSSGPCAICRDSRSCHWVEREARDCLRRAEQRNGCARDGCGYEGD